jgi:predicted ATPase
VADIHSITTGRAVVENLNLDNQFDKVRRWLCPADSSTNLNEAQKKRHQRTGPWFLKSQIFKRWKTGKCQHLWLHGLPGCGKTVLSATIIKNLNQQLDAPHVVLFFFFDFTGADNSRWTNLSARLLHNCSQNVRGLEKS